MQTFAQFLNEKDSTDEVRKMAQAVYRDCQPFLKQIPNGKLNKHSLYRGMRNDAPLLNRVRKDRQPKDMKREVHEFLDGFFFEDFGVRYRSQAMFCSPSMQMADEYGRVYLIFPKGEFDYSYSPKYHDLWVDWRKFVDVSPTFGNDMEPEVTKEMVRKFYDAGDYVHNENFPGIWTASNDSGDMVELMVHCDEYYAVPADSEYFFFRTLRKLMESGE